MNEDHAESALHFPRCVCCGELLYSERAQRRGVGLECFDRLGAEEVARRRASAIDDLFSALTGT